MRIENSKVARARTLFDEGRTLQAFHALGPTAGGLAGGGLHRPGPPTELPTSVRILLGRMVRQLGAPRLGTAMLIRAWRANPHDPEACYHHARNLLALKGAAAAQAFIVERGLLEDADADLRADWVSLRGFVCARLGDSGGAWSWLERARSLSPRSSWLAVERSFVLELEDRFEEALAEAQDAARLDPRSRSAVQQASALALSLGRPVEARDLLQRATRWIESADLCVQLAQAREELGLHQAALAELRRARTILPLAEDGQRRWFDGLESDAAYRAGDVPASIRLARRCGSEHHARLASAMERYPDSPRQPTRVRLPVPFVRQRRFACAPATAAMLGRYWGIRLDPLAVEAMVSEGGTTQRALRAWAEGQGFLVRELTVDLEIAVELLDRGLPFALTTFDREAAHMQVVVGYDRCRQTLLVRDPSRPESSELPWRELAARSRRPGPRGLLFAPASKARELTSLELPEAGLYDLLHEAQQCLHVGDLAGARAAAARLEGRAAGHPLEILARSSLGAAEGKPENILACIEEMLTGYPDEADGILRRIEGLLPREGADPEGIG